MAHTHGELDLAPGEVRRARRILTALVVPLLVATVIGLAVLWPRGESAMGSLELTSAGMTIESAEVVEVSDVPGEEVRARLLSGAGEGQVVPVQVPPEILDTGVDVGDRLRLFFTASALGSGSPYVFWDFERSTPIAALALLYVLVVVLVARWRGLAAMAGLGASLAVVVLFILPALMLGSSPLLVALVGSSAMMFVSVYLAHGISIRTTTALLGTFLGLATTTALATWGTRSAELTGASSDSSLMLVGMFPGLNLRDLLLCGIVIAGLGALNDVTITQASAVWELHATDRTVPRRQLMRRGMRIGRDHIASTVYTLAFAYVGTALPVLLVAGLFNRPFTDTLMAGEIAEEIVRTLVSSIGLVLAIPATTAIAAALVRTARPERTRGGKTRGADDDGSGRHAEGGQHAGAGLAGGALAGGAAAGGAPAGRAHAGGVPPDGADAGGAAAGGAAVDSPGALGPHAGGAHASGVDSDGGYGVGGTITPGERA